MGLTSKFGRRSVCYMTRIMDTTDLSQLGSENVFIFGAEAEQVEHLREQVKYAD